MTAEGCDPSSLDERAREAAERAECTRCSVRILSDDSKAGLVFGRVFVPVSDARHSFQLCGKCGLALREFLKPSLVDDPEYQLAKHRLLTEFWL